MRIFHKPETFVSLFVEQLVCVISCNMSKTQIDPRIRQLKIKIGVVKRIIKEKNMYEKEFISLLEIVDKMVANKKCEHDIRKQKEVADESRQMIPDTARRLRQAHKELQILCESESGLTEMDQYEEAQMVLKEAEDALTVA